MHHISKRARYTLYNRCIFQTWHVELFLISHCWVGASSVFQQNIQYEFPLEKLPP